MRIFLLLTILLFPAISSAQLITSSQEADSLVARLSSLTGRQKAKWYYEIVYYYRRVDIDKAGIYANASREMLSLDDSVSLAYTYATSGLYFLTTSSLDSAAYYLERSKERSIAAGPVFFAGVCNTLANVYLSSGKAERGIANLLEGLRSLEKQPDRAVELKLASNITWAYLELKRYRDCIKAGYRATRGSIKGFELTALYTFNNMAASYGALGQLDSATYYAKLSISLTENVDDHQGTANAHFILGTIYSDAGRYDAAIDEYLEAQKYREKVGNPLFVVSDLYTLSGLYYRTGDYRKGIAAGQDALKLARQHNLVLKLGDTYDALAKNYEGLKDYANASEYYKLLAAAKDSVYQYSNAETIARMQMQYETEKKERELAEANVKVTTQELTVQKRNNQLVIAGAAIVLIVIAGMVIYRNQAVTQQRLELKAQLAEARTVNAIQEERLRISQELHDNIGSHLTFVSTSMDVLERTIPDDRITEIRKITSSTIQELRKTVWLINKQSATLEEVAIKLREYIPLNNIPPVSLKVDGDIYVMIPAHLANQLFRIVQESVSNATKHSGATAIAVAILSANRKINITVSDNGRGFDVTMPTSGFGLRNMKKRVESVGGTFSIDSRPSQTIISVVMPVV